jgi:hypothetical protein
MALTPDGTGLIVEVSDGEKSPTQLPKRYVCWNVANGDERWSARGLWFIRHPVAGGPWLVLARRDPATGANEAVILDAASGSEVSRVSIVTQDWFKDAATDGRTLLIVTPHPLGLDAIWTGLARQGLPGPEPSSAGHLQMLDVATGQRLYALPGVDTAYAADGQCLAVLEPSGRLALWDVPPRKPLLWYAGICALLALSLAWMARRRVRRLRRVAAATS